LTAQYLQRKGIAESRKEKKAKRKEEEKKLQRFVSARTGRLQ
jgi:hypothetical protein